MPAAISVIIPTHNRATMLLRAIESAGLAATDLEIIVVDDASSDQTPAICHGLKEITYLRMEHNVGLARARNAGIAGSSGKYIAFLDAIYVCQNRWICRQKYWRPTKI